MSLWYRGQCIDNRIGDLPLDPPDDDIDPPETRSARCKTCGRFRMVEDGAVSGNCKDCRYSADRKRELEKRLKALGVEV